MATLKSFELLGNKKSFANWISNLSPCDSPFTSMIGKEAIDQTQYSWQTDALAPATIEAFEEGSQAVSQPRAATEVITNFTSILRTVASVSDTANALNLYGRQKELSYQLGKAGKEILRDLEHMNLHNLNGVAGGKNRASSFAGFEGLVAGLNVAEADTGAIVHKSVQNAGVNIDKDDIFSITTGLYLTSSKADKIMFHPKYAVSFSAFINNDADTPGVFRMFDGLGTTYNAQVSTIKDPLGKIWTLIPNRFMPEDKIYFFNESDWTQTVFRAPHSFKIGKKGSSDRYAVEMEVGLRHRHPYASGILHLASANITNYFVPSVRLFTSHIKERLEVESSVVVDGVAEAGLNVVWHTSDASVAKYADYSTSTDVAGKAQNELVIGNKAGVADLWSVCKGVKSQVTRITVANPTIELVADNLTPTAPEVVTLTATIKKLGGATVPVNDLTIKWFVNPGINLEMTSTSNVTVSGVATGTGQCMNSDETLVQATLDSINSNMVFLNYVPKVGVVEKVQINPNTIPIGSVTDVGVLVLDERSVPMGGVLVSWTSSDETIGKTNVASSVTDDKGIAVQALTGISRGTADLTATADGVISDATIFFVGQNASLDLEISPDPAKVDEEVRFYGSIKGQDGKGIPDVAFVITDDAFPALRLDITTDDDGEFDVKHIFTDNSDRELTVAIPSLNINHRESLQVN